MTIVISLPTIRQPRSVYEKRSRIRWMTVRKKRSVRKSGDDKLRQKQVFKF
jgi:hypothetical protein